MQFNDITYVQDIFERHKEKGPIDLDLFEEPIVSSNNSINFDPTIDFGVAQNDGELQKHPGGQRSWSERNVLKIVKIRMENKFEPVIVVDATEKQTGTIIFFHDSVSDAPTVYERIKKLTEDKFNFPHLKIIFPTAPKMPFTATGGEMANVWFDRYASSIHVPENTESVEKACKNLTKLIKEEMEKSNLSENHVLFGGYSMGGAMGIYLYAYKYFPNIAGIFAISSFLNYDTKVYEKIDELNSKCPIFMAHGKQDNLIKYEWAKETFDNLKKTGIDGEFHSFNGDHELDGNVVLKAKEWIMKVFSEDGTKPIKN